MYQLPMDAIGRKTPVKVHIAFFIVAAEHTRKTIVERDDGTVKDAVRGGDEVTRDDRVR